MNARRAADRYQANAYPTPRASIVGPLLLIVGCALWGCVVVEWLTGAA